MTRQTEEIDDDDRILAVALALFATEIVLVEEESGHIRREDGCVDDQQKNNPVPDCFEGRIMQYCPFVDTGRLQFVLGKDVGAQREDLRFKHKHHVLCITLDSR